MDEERRGEAPRVFGEVVEEYRQQPPREVVETYSRPLPAAGGGKQVAPLPRRRSLRGLWIFLLCCAAVAAITAFAWWWNESRTPAVPPQSHILQETDRGQDITISTYPTGQGVTLTIADTRGPSCSAQEIYRRVNPSVVTVVAQLASGTGASVGTGVIFTEDGYILTNYHVLEGCKDAAVGLSNGRSYQAAYVAGDAKNDLAVLKTELTELPAAEFGNSEDLTVGDKVYAIGNPLGVELRGTLTDGIVSAINRDVWVDGRTMTLLQTNAALNSGNSGGPLINDAGQVVGINTIKMSSSYSNIEGLGFAIPSASIGRLVNDLLTYGEIQPEPTLGVTVSQLGTRVSADVWGVEVLSVVPGGAAEAAGIQIGDFIVAAGGLDVTASSDLLRARKQYHIGDEMPLTLWRDGGPRTVTLTLQTAADQVGEEPTP